MQTILITGVNGGIGQALAKKFIQEEWAVFGTDVHATAKIKGLKNYYSCNFLNSNQLQSLAKKIEKEVLGKLNGIIHNAALQSNLSIAKVNEKEIQNLFQVNISAPMLLNKYLLKSLAKSNGSIVLISSVHAHATSKNVSTYASTKGAMVAYARAAAIELSEFKIRVNAIMPGATDTEMLRAGLKRGHAGKSNPMKVLIDRHPLKRIGLPNEIAEAAYFLIDSRKSGFITGQSLIIDGGALAHLSTE